MVRLRPCTASASNVTNVLPKVTIGARGSKLALKQAQQVKRLLQHVRPERTDMLIEIVHFTTHGDQNTEQQLRSLGQGAFTEVIDQAVVNGSIDLAVHSLKDQPVLLPVGVILAACLPREDSRDVFISRKAKTPGSLPAGSRVGTSSMRRKAQLLYAHPHLKVVPVRGNIDKRMEMMADGQLDAIVLAAAGLLRMGQLHLATGILGFDEMLPAGCQGAVGVTCQSSDQGIRRELALINHEATMLEVTAERALVAQLLDTANNRPHLGEADSSSSTSTSGQQGAAAAHTSSITGLRMLPNFAIACHAGFDPHEGVLTLDGLVASEDGKVVDRLQQSGGVTDPADAESIGRTLGQQLRQFARDHGWLQAQA